MMSTIDQEQAVDRVARRLELLTPSSIDIVQARSFLVTAYGAASERELLELDPLTQVSPAMLINEGEVDPAVDYATAFTRLLSVLNYAEDYPDIVEMAPTYILGAHGWQDAGMLPKRLLSEDYAWSKDALHQRAYLIDFQVQSPGQRLMENGLTIVHDGTESLSFIVERMEESKLIGGNGRPSPTASAVPIITRTSVPDRSASTNEVLFVHADAQGSRVALSRAKTEGWLFTGRAWLAAQTPGSGAVDQLAYSIAEYIASDAGGNHLLAWNGKTWSVARI